MDKPHTRDETTGRNWVIESAEDVRFLAVSGTIWIGDTSLWYEFTLVEYHVYIDEVSWLIFSVLGGASDREFSHDFFKTLNPSRKDKWDFHNVAWLEGKNRYEVAQPYEEFVLSIFDTFGTTLRTVRLREHVDPSASSPTCCGSICRGKENCIPATTHN